MSFRAQPELSLGQLSFVFSRLVTSLNMSALKFGSNIQADCERHTPATNAPGFE
jgi:hypothetical protein